jgi:hypothetical protein
MTDRFWADPDDVLFSYQRRSFVTYLPSSWDAGVLEPQQYKGTLTPLESPNRLCVSGRLGGTGSGVAVTNRHIRRSWPAFVTSPWSRAP